MRPVPLHLSQMSLLRVSPALQYLSALVCFEAKLPGIVTDLHLSEITVQKPQSPLTSPSLSINAKGSLKNKSSTKKAECGYSTWGEKQGACQNMCCLKAGLLSRFESWESRERRGKGGDSEAEGKRERKDE